MATTVHVEGISTKTSEDEIKSFFSFCGKIQSLSVTPTDDSTQSATVTFEKNAAAKTALLLDNTQLGPNSVHVSAAKSIDDLAGEKGTTEDEAHHDKHDVEQEEKPRSRILAEYLAHGYVISDKAIERALTLDQQHGITSKFASTLKTIDNRLQATQKAQAVDTKFGVTEKALAGWRGLNSYFEKASGTPTGQKLRQFYEVGNKNVMDVHNEARHLADLKTKGSATGEKPSVEEAQVEQIPGSEKTKCNCGATAEKCPCPPGKCGCTNCSKNESTIASAST
ncbi:actin cytoskeleton protein-like protein [Clohesyomyces aquaticus]|uniref:Actin cytoskeleton protein-like protein n=1 Tax=Clohesyomyces aquaticus TaxID=1231657 RepID=A0A1Y1ZYH0_9PLEO|nr:actin cytoskeleton protein-like protein [Clohesyomyces aquaticus]